MPSDADAAADDPPPDDPPAGLTHEEREGAATRAVEQVALTLAAQRR
ncbi:hypothetical protein [Haloarcula onubensis]|uniref:Uncharacterized protein n=1 Tax=Haloarcula onubensis TaxID=2950539 RepID=A0ABU2FN89_9EURY|nr:hypothetical protein [Halomicroarcula sp. S3CR25-11]MDS0282213.1 hypothetical protein [Halomicroarcula sp. S3CR25-11]